MTSLQDAIANWIAGHEDEMSSTQLRISTISGSCLLLQVYSKNIHMSIPSSSQEVFLVTAADPNPDPLFDAALLLLNEKLERLPSELGAFFVAMEYLLRALKQLQSNAVPQLSVTSTDDNVNDDGGGDGDGNGDYLGAHEVGSRPRPDMASTVKASGPSPAFICSKGFVYAMAMEAKRQCELARRQFPNPFTTSMSSALAWCIVKPNPSALSIDIKMQMGGIFHDNVVAASLGLSVDVPMHMSLEISKDLWSRAQPSSIFKIVACHVFDHSKDFSGDRVLKRSNMHADELRYKDKRHNFGKEVLLPELIHCFFNYLERKDQSIANSSDILKELEEFTTMGNPIVGLINFLAARMRALPNCCIACWDALPYKVGRLRTCDKDLCLYKFEDLGLGSNILQEVHKSRELMDLEISLAIAAVSSYRDVFEPFPAFLLEKEEIRGRSGWFSKRAKPDASQPMASDGRGSRHEYRDNKSLSVLESILNAYPSLDEMQCLNDELDLKKALANLWLKSSYVRNHPEWRQKSWLPYDVLRFIFSSNRLTICCLKGSEKLFPNEGTIYQFVVLHDNPEKEAQFEKRRTEMGGSFFAFHGSQAGNWFSILRNGLRSLSNTHYMSSGAACGAGIYFATHMAKSLRYASQDTGWNHGQLNCSFKVLAICEIVNGSLESRDEPSDMKRVQPEDILVVRPECEQDILIRYILVFPGDMATRHDDTATMIHEQTHSTSSGGCQTDLSDHHSHCREMYYTRQQSELEELRKAGWLSLSAMCKMEDEEGRTLQTLS